MGTFDLLMLNASACEHVLRMEMFVWSALLVIARALVINAALSNDHQEESQRRKGF